MEFKIEEKCQQNWDELSSFNKQEKYCELCTKCVHDLDDYSFKEIKDFLENNSSSCVKIKRRNLEQFNSFETSKSLSHQTKKWFQLSSVISFLSLTTITNAQERVENDSIVLKGVVSDINNFPEADIFINLKGTNLNAYTDENGKFELKIPKNEMGYELELGHEIDNKQLFTVLDSSTSQSIVLRNNYLDEDNKILLGAVVIKHYKRKKFFRNLGRTIAWPIKQIASIF